MTRGPGRLQAQVELKFGIAVPFPIPQSLRVNMPLTFAPGFRVCCVAVALALVTAHAAEPKPPSLIGATREQVLARLGEPKSNILAGSREVLFFARERIVLRDNVVIEVEQLPAEAPPPPPPAPMPAKAAPEATADTPSAGTNPPAANAENNVAPKGGTSAAPDAKSGTAPTAAAPVAPPADAPLAIKSVRRAGTSAPRSGATPTPKAETTAPVPTPSPATASTTPPQTAVPVAPKSDSAAPAASTAVTAPDSTAAIAPAPEAAKAEDAAPEPEPAKKAPKRAPRRIRTEEDLDEPVPSLFTGRTYAIAFFTIVGGIGYLYWRSRQRQLALAATAVSRTPFTAPTTSEGGGARFTADLLGKLEWKRFEELVAAYYSKTGVVAVRTKSGPASAVHIKISWKGEPRPFACVQCISRPTGLIDAKPLQDLFAVLGAEDIRRGYVVSTGKFNVAARDFAEEKHLTLLPGDIFLEKLNALPDPARNELMQEIMAGDFATPSCPKCEAKMTRSPDDPSVWRCAAHPDQTIAAK